MGNILEPYLNLTDFQNFLLMLQLQGACARNLSCASKSFTSISVAPWSHLL